MVRVVRPQPQQLFTPLSLFHFLSFCFDLTPTLFSGMGSTVVPRGGSSARRPSSPAPPCPPRWARRAAGAQLRFFSPPMFHNLTHFPFVPFPPKSVASTLLVLRRTKVWDLLALCNGSLAGLVSSAYLPPFYPFFLFLFSSCVLFASSFSLSPPSHRRLRVLRALGGAARGRARRAFVPPPLRVFTIPRGGRPPRGWGHARRLRRVGAPRRGAAVPPHRKCVGDITP